MHGGILKFAVDDDFTTLDPALINGHSTYTVSRNTRDGLLTLDPKWKLGPELAETWEETGGKDWVFHLRKDVQWHSGRGFVARDVVDHFKRLMDPKVGSPANSYLQIVDSVGQDDDYTVVFKLKSKYPEFPILMDLTQCKIAPYDQPVDTLDKKVIGTGPFILEDLVPGEKAVLRKNDKYWGKGLPYLDGVEVLIVPDQNAQVAGLQTGTIDINFQLDFDFYTLLKADKRVVVMQSDPIITEVIYMDTRKKPFDDVRVRQAIKYAIDRKAMSDTVYYGQAKVDYDSPLIPSNPYRVDVGITAPDVAKGKQLLTDAGYPNGFEVDLWTGSDKPSFMRLAQVFQEQVRAIGVKINIQGMPVGQFWAEKWLVAPMGISDWGPRPSADAQLRIAYACDAAWNESHFCSKDLGPILDQAVSEPDPAKRTDLYTQAQKIIAMEGGSILPYQIGLLEAVNGRVNGYAPPATGPQPNLVSVWLSPAA